MTERLLQFIWQFRHFNITELVSTGGEPIDILYGGQINSNQGPDFTDARIRIGATTWAGAVELHLFTSGWTKHGHQLDRNYDNVILHVVWEHDEGESDIPVLELKNRVSKLLLLRYEELMHSRSFIPCEQTLPGINDINLRSWKERLLAERLLRKTENIDSKLQLNQYHWEEVFWWLLARNFGYPVNADPFEALARSISLKIISKHRKQLHQAESLLLGQAGLLSSTFIEDYPILLQKEYQFLRNKYSLSPILQPVHFLRMRPANFPTIRLAQLAKLIHTTSGLFDMVRETGELNVIRQLFNVMANDYWHYHYRFDEISAYREKTLGETMINSIIINTISPMLFSYGNYNGENKYKEKAIQWLEQTPPEYNHLTRGFMSLGIENQNAFDSQALIELKTHYCDRKRCLECAIGNQVLKMDNRQ